MFDFKDIFGEMPRHKWWQMEMIGDHLFSIAVPTSSPAAFKKMVFAAAKTYMLGNKSVDHILKQYGDVWRFGEESLNPYESLYLDVCETVDEWVKTAVSRSSGIPDKRDHHGLFASGTALLRLQVSFSTALLLLREGKWLELACIEKLILEQIAWAYAVRDLEGDALFDTLPSKTIKLLHKVFPQAGQLYGWLNRDAHINPEQTIEYLDFSGVTPRVFLASPRRTARAAYFLLLLADLYQVCSEIVYAEYLESSCSIILKNGKFIGLKKRRPSVKIIKVFRRRLQNASKHNDMPENKRIRSRVVRRSPDN